MERTEYRIIGRFAKDEKPHVVDFNRNWTLADAERRLHELVREGKQEKKNGGSTTKCGCIGISTPYYPEYELLDLKIQSRTVTSWT